MAPASYAMTWRIGDGDRRAGRIEVDTDALSLSATTPGAAVDTIRFRDIARVVLERSILRVERAGGEPVRIVSLDTPGALRELADRLSNAMRVPNF